MVRVRLIVVLAGLETCQLGCGTSSRARACQPDETNACGREEQCVIDADGVPTCVARRSDSKDDGETCDAPDACRPGRGCLRVFGVARCARFCKPRGDSPDLPCERVTPDAESGLCAGAVPGRPDIGFCIYECLPELLPGDPGPGACPPESRCGVPADLEYPTCMALFGEAREGERCGPEVSCGEALLCDLLGSRAVCRKPADSEGMCPEDLVARPLSNAPQIKVCLPCAPLPGADSEDTTRYYGCFVRSTRASALKACLAEGGQLAKVNTLAEADRLIVSTRLSFPSDEGFWVGAAPFATGEWRWTDGSDVDPDLFADGVPPHDAPRCALLGRDGRLHPSDCLSTLARPLCRRD